MVHTADIVARILRSMIARKLSLYKEKVSLDLEEEKEIDIVQEISCLRNRLTEGI